MDRSVRIILGVASLVMLVAGTYMAWTGDRLVGGALLRVGAVSGAAWLVAPAVRRPSWGTVLFLVAVGLVLIRPRLLIAVVVAAVIWWSSRRKREASSTRKP